VGVPHERSNNDERRSEGAIRERMASTGENYTTAKRAIEQARSHGRERVSPLNDLVPHQATFARSMTWRSRSS